MCFMVIDPLIGGTISFSAKPSFENTREVLEIPSQVWIMEFPFSLVNFKKGIIGVKWDKTDKSK